MNNKPYLIALNQIPGMGPRTILRLLQHWPSLKDCFALSYTQLLHLKLPPALAYAIHHVNWSDVETLMQFEQHPNHHLLTWADPGYPSLLKEIADPPPVLYAIGDLSCLQFPLLAMVGSRRPSHNGKATAYKWATDLAQHPLTIVSGLAAGIDTAVHQGCVDVSGKTIAVFGTGVDVIYPANQRTLAEKITQNGLILSEFPLKTTAKAGHFPRRNRIISGLSLATLVMEATLKSGSLITARLAIEQNRDVLTLPGSIHLPQAQGCHHLLKQGATLVTSCQDVLEALGLAPQLDPADKPRDLGISTGGQRDVGVGAVKDALLNCVDYDLTPIDTIVQRSGLQLNHVASRLAGLEIEGAILRMTGGYIRVPSTH
ncbi:MAG: DNA-processing protein DprA [Gammaproteobacteria bacterium]|nr:DNA-processing protein DprA [Gammaproteobacteria bacterium]